MNDITTDKIGKETLNVVGEADQFNKWMFETILPFTKGRILEIGSGLGNISKFFLDKNYEIYLTDLREEYCIFLKNEFHGKKNLLGIDQLELTHPQFETIYKEHLEKYDTVFALNVIEHIQDDHLAILNCKKLLNHNGKLIVLVPSYQKLYNKFDAELGHYRRYNRKILSEIFIANNFKIIHEQYFNCMGILGWYVSGSLMRKESIPSPQMKLYDKLVPAWKYLDQVLNNRVGLSTIVVGQK